MIWTFFNKIPFTYRLVAGLALVLVLALAFQLSNCRNKRDEKNLDNLEKQQTISETTANIKEQEKTAQNANLREIEANRKQTENGFANVKKKDSSTYDSSAAEDRFCRRFPCDSTCYSWHQKHSEVGCD